MKIGLVCAEYFGSRIVDGKLVPTSTHGWFGFLTKAKAEYLSSIGHDVHVFTYSSSFEHDQKGPSSYTEDGVKIHLITEKEREHKTPLSTGLSYLVTRPKANELFEDKIRKEEIEILQFEDTPTTLMLADVGKVPRLLVFQVPFNYYDNNLLIDSGNNYMHILDGKAENYNFKSEGYKFPNETAINFLHRKNFINPIKKIIEDLPSLNIFTEADFIGKKVQEMFDLSYTPPTLRNPIDVYEKAREKTPQPTFVWIGRWDPQKRVDTMLKVARDLPEYDFYLIGTATRGAKNYISVEEKLTYEFSKYSNIHILGFVDETAKREYIGKSWALINTSVREGLPITFLEAMAEGTSIISYVDPDGYTSRFGIKVNYSISAFKEGIKKAVEQQLYKTVGAAEREYVRREHRTDIVMNKHLTPYKNLLGGTNI